MVDPERWQRIKEVFSAALELPPGQRAAWLSSTLTDDPSLVAEVENLLAAHAAEDTADDFFERGALAAVPDLRRQLEGEIEGMHLGPYRILSELGRGGMGAVYLAVRDEPGFTRKVAVKLVKRGMDTEEIVRRFVAERQILASLAHPNVARLFDVGSAPDGRPYFVMEYVEGKPITAYADERKLSVEARLHLFLCVCRAVQHAHQSLVVHRDLKPANILVDAEGEPKLLDFGIAKLLDPGSIGGMTALTGLAPGPMTPDYASPEQRAGGPVTTATDVYGLGLLLYELLVGKSRRSVQAELGEGWSDRPPGQVLRALAAGGDAEQRRLARRLAGDLDTIVGKALERDPVRRYGTAAALAEDIERHLTQRPVAARRPTLAYRLGRALARHRVAAALTLGLGLFAATSFLQTLALRQERDHAEAQRQRAEALNGFLRGLIQKANPEQSRGESLTVRQVLDAGAGDLMGRESRYQPATWAALLETMGNTYGDLGLYDDARRNLERALLLRQRQHDRSRAAALEIALNLSALGHVALHQERYGASRRAYEQALAIKRRRLPHDALPLAEDWNGLGLVALYEGDTGAAARHFDEALAISRRAVEGDQRALADSLNNLGTLAAREGRFARAQVFFRAAYRHFQATRGGDHPDAILARSNLAYAAFQLGDPAEAEALYQEIADLRRRLLGPDHPNLARTLLQLAIVQHQRRRVAEARATLDELLRIRREHRLPRDRDEAETWNLLGAVAFAQNHLDTAEDAFAESHALYRSLPGEHRTELANVLRRQALVRRRRSDLPGAIALARRSLELARAASGEEHPGLADPHHFLAELLEEAGRFESAEPAYRRALALRSGAPWADHPARALSLVGLGRLLLATGRAEAARPLLEDGLRIRRLALPAGDPAIARAEGPLGSCYAALGDESRARPLLEHSHQVLLSLYGTDHPDTRKARDRLRGLTAAR